jgi:hypothetical protein
MHLNESIALGDWRLAFLDRDNLEKVTRGGRARGIALFEAKRTARSVCSSPSKTPTARWCGETKCRGAAEGDYKGSRRSRRARIRWSLENTKATTRVSLRMIGCAAAGESRMR